MACRRVLEVWTLAHPTRFGHVTSTFGGWRSIQLSYGAFVAQYLDNPKNECKFIFKFDQHLGIFPPKEDPAGDYSLVVFKRAEAVRLGAENQLSSKTKIVSINGSGQSCKGRGLHHPSLP